MTTTSTVQGYYTSILNRTGNASEVAGWANLVDNGSVTLAQVQTNFANSFEALNNVAPIVKMYQADLNRVPDQAGLMYWVNAEEAGTATLAQISSAIAGSAESQAYYGVANDVATAASIGLMYTTILGRTADTSGLAYWLATGASEATIQQAIGNSAEANTRAAPALTAFFSSVSQGTPGAYTGSLYTATGSGTTFSLTPGINTGAAFTGTANADTFNGDEIVSALGVAVPAWGAGDSIDGGAGNDTFNVIQTAAITKPPGSSVTNIETANLVSGSTVTLDTTAWTGLTALNVTDTGATGLTVSPTTAVKVSDTAGAVSVTGGSTQTVNTSAGAATLNGATDAITLTDTAVGGNSVTINGGTTVDAAISGVNNGGGTISIGGTSAPTGAVSLTTTELATQATSTADAINVTGGTTVAITANLAGAVATSTITGGAITVNGKATTTSVAVNQTAAATAAAEVSGVVDGAVTITDVNNASLTAAGTITSVTANNYTTLGINDNALTTLSVAGGSGNITIGNGNLTTPTNKTLGVTATGLTGGSLSDSGVYTALNVTTAGTDSTLANISEAAVTALTVAGSNRLTLTSTAGLAALKTVTVSGAAGLTAGLSGLGTVTVIDTSATTGSSTVTLNGGVATFTGGAGVDNVTLATAATKAISLGDGNDSLVLGALVPTAAISGGAGTDTLSVDATAAATASGSGVFAGLVTGFEKLVLTGATNQAVDVGALGVATSIQTSGGNGLTLSNVSNGGTLTLTGAGTAYTIDNAAFVAGAADVISLALTDGSGGGGELRSDGHHCCQCRNDCHHDGGYPGHAERFVQRFGHASRQHAEDDHGGR